MANKISKLFSNIKKNILVKNLRNAEGREQLFKDALVAKHYFLDLEAAKKIAVFRQKEKLKIEGLRYESLHDLEDFRPIIEKKVSERYLFLRKAYAVETLKQNKSKKEPNPEVLQKLAEDINEQTAAYRKELEAQVLETIKVNTKDIDLVPLNAEKDAKVAKFSEETLAKYASLKQKYTIKYNKIVEKKHNKVEKLKTKLAVYTTEEHKLPEDTVLEVKDLCMFFGGVHAVENLSFDVKKGEIFGLIGPNGAGKTTVFNCITQFYKPTSGELYFENKLGHVVDLNTKAVHDVICEGIVRTFQNIEVVKEISVLDNLLIAAHRQYHTNIFEHMIHSSKLAAEDVVIKQKALKVLEFMGLTQYAGWYAFGLPYGVLKKIEIARTLMSNPQLIILDEPAAGLNDTETAELADLIYKIKDEYNCTILLVEHDMGLVMKICDHICAISFGKKLGYGTAKEIQANKDVQAAYLGVTEE